MAKQFSYKLPVVITKQGKKFIAYTPALDLSTSGKSKKEVQKRFGEIVSIFMEEISSAGTINEVLYELGWKKVQQRWNPPKILSPISIGVDLPSLV